MTRILRLLMIAAIALPMWQPVAAQEVVQNQNPKKILQKERVEKMLPTAPKVKLIAPENAQDLLQDQQMEETVEVENISIVEQNEAPAKKAPSLKATENVDITVADGTVENGNVPIYLWYLEAANHGQSIYLASDLGITPDSKIKSITFYTNSNLTKGGGSGDNTVTLKLGETESTSFSSTTFNTSDLTTVATLTSTQILNGTKSVTFTFSTPYEYQGGNLVVDVSSPRLSGGQYASSGVKWYGITSNGSSIHGYNSSGSNINSSTQYNFLPKMTMNVEMAASEETFALDFETVNVGSSKTLNAYVANELNEPVTATVTASAPFTVASNTVTLDPSEDGTTPIAVTFTPTLATNYNGTLTVVAGDRTKTIRLTGIGNQDGVPCTRDSAFFAGIEYKWPINSTNQQTSSLDEIATDPDQIIAMLREVYMNRNIPGNIKRGYTTTGGTEAFDDVHYSGIGKITRGNGYNSATYYSYNDGYGWNIPGDIKYKSISYFNGNATAHCAFMDSTQYKPYQEGVTLVLLEMKDNFSTSNISSPTTSYESLRDYIVNSVKSARIVTDAKRTGNRSDYSSGTLFKIDCEKMNKFFLLAKGQLRWYNDANGAPYVYDNTNYVFGSNSGNLIGTPCFLYSRYNYQTVMDQYNEDFSVAPFYHMFEQFSPVADDATAAKSDIYQDLINMESFGVEHDCMGVSHMGHQFQMYGNESAAADCQDVQDMMFFVPDYRMMYWENLTDTIGRDVVYDNLTVADNQKFRNYNLNHQPTVGLYVIRQNEITATTETDDYYMLNLNWETNLDDFLPSDDQEFELLQIIVDPETGEESYVPVYYMNANGQYTDAQDNVVTTPVPIFLTMEAGRVKNYPSVYVERNEASKEVTYAIRGRDKGHFLGLQYSNRQSYIIPGTDLNEMIRLTDATHYSRFNPQTVSNCYSNKLQFENNALGLNNNKINGLTALNIVRSHVEIVDGVNTIKDDTIATITFDQSNNNLIVTMNMDSQSPIGEYPNGKTSGQGAGYHANPGDSWTQSYTVVTSGSNSGNITINPALIIYDNFVVDVSENAHPNSYTYRVESNYEGAAAMYLDAPSPYTDGSEIWYAWSWPENGNGEWVRGIKQGNLVKFSYNVSNNKIKFVRMNPNGGPSWADGIAWNQTQDLDAHDGGTYTITSWNGDNDKMSVSYTAPAADYSSNAHSNEFRIPVYKTDSKISSFTEAQVLADEDGLMELPNTVDFEVDVQRGSKTEIYRYDAYRWMNKAPTQRFIIDKVLADDDEEDLPPTGIAGNQGETYSVSMNEVGTNDYITSTTSLGADGWGVAKFEDMIPPKTKEAAIFDYAPVVEILASGFDKNREDYNTYGGPLQSTATAKAKISVVQPDEDYPLMSEHKWQEENGNWYAYYNMNINVDTKDVPDGYDIYMIRAWREIDESLLGEEYEEMADRISGDVLFEEIKYPNYDKNDTYVLGSKPGTVEVEGADGQIHSYRCFKGTFGAQKLRTSEDETGVIDELDALFTVRIYFTKNENLPQTQSEVDGAPALRDGEPAAAGDGKFYVVEAVVDKTFKSNEVVTGIIQNLNTRQVVSEKYYNVAGIESDTPFEGVNIVVTRYSDGSTTTTKILK